MRKLIILALLALAASGCGTMGSLVKKSVLPGANNPFTFTDSVMVMLEVADQLGGCQLNLTTKWEGELSKYAPASCRK